MRGSAAVVSARRPRWRHRRAGVGAWVTEHGTDTRQAALSCRLTCSAVGQELLLIHDIATGTHQGRGHARALLRATQIAHPDVLVWQLATDLDGDGLWFWPRVAGPWLRERCGVLLVDQTGQLLEALVGANPSR